MWDELADALDAANARVAAIPKESMEKLRALANDKWYPALIPILAAIDIATSTSNGRKA